MSDNPIVFSFNQPFSGRRRAYIYFIYSKEMHVGYVGQTNQHGGPLQRLGQHLGKYGTFRNCLYNFDGIEIEDITDLVMVALPLPDETAFRTEFSTYREGVEYLLQKRLESDGAVWSPYFYLVSQVKTSTTTSLREIQEIADRFYNVGGSLLQVIRFRLDKRGLRGTIARRHVCCMLLCLCLAS